MGRCTPVETHVSVSALRQVFHCSAAPEEYSGSLRSSSAWRVPTSYDPPADQALKLGESIILLAMSVSCDDPRAPGGSDGPGLQRVLRSAPNCLLTSGSPSYGRACIHAVRAPHDTPSFRQVYVDELANQLSYRQVLKKACEGIQLATSDANAKVTPKVDKSAAILLPPGPNPSRV